MATIKTVVRQPDPPEEMVATEVLATAIVAISKGITQLRSGRLTDKALLLLIKANVKKPTVTLKQINAVLNSIESLQHTYVKK